MWTTQSRKQKYTVKGCSVRLCRLYTAQGQLPKSASGAEIQVGFAFANPCVLVQSWAALRQGCLFLTCTKMSACQAVLPQDCVGSEELLLSNLPRGLYGLPAALPILGRLLIPFPLVGNKIHMLLASGEGLWHTQYPDL